MIINIYCDIGGRKTVLYDKYTDEYILAYIAKPIKCLGEYNAILFALDYIINNYPYQEIRILTDGQSESNVLNSRFFHHREPLKSFIKKIKHVLDLARETNIVHVTWIPREENYAGRFLQKFHSIKTKEHANKYLKRCIVSDYNREVKIQVMKV